VLLFTDHGLSLDDAVIHIQLLDLENLLTHVPLQLLLLGFVETWILEADEGWLGRHFLVKHVLAVTRLVFVLLYDARVGCTAQLCEQTFLCLLDHSLFWCTPCHW
jgi:hypothetical protein